MVGFLKFNSRGWPNVSIVKFGVRISKGCECMGQGPTQANTFRFADRFFHKPKSFKMLE
uniref:Uncharacterized protein n=1 Tax=Meloidogyne enterolobii TaxID=390850 RepID=A0A6V7TR37_MELEN|nr:unnamed protein product [Meloidogyne enterolobii]